MNPQEIVDSIHHGKTHPNYYSALDQAWRSSPEKSREIVSIAAKVSPELLAIVKSTIKIYIP